MLDLTDQPRTALVTGASRGIGRGIAIRLASMGHSVAVNYNSHEDEALEVVEEIRRAGGTATAVGGSVASKEGCEQIVAGAVETLGPVEILINNAGVISDNLLIRMKDEQLEHTINTNLWGTIHCTRLVVPGMVKGRWGRIINISSIVGIRGNLGQSNYSASKAAIHGFTYSVAKELAKRNITVNVVAPGYVATATSEVISDRARQFLLDVIPMGRFGYVEEIVPMVAFLTKEEARYITGDVIRVDGGLAI